MSCGICDVGGRMRGDIERMQPRQDDTRERQRERKRDNDSRDDVKGDVLTCSIYASVVLSRTLIQPA